MKHAISIVISALLAAAPSISAPNVNPDAELDAVRRAIESGDYDTAIRHAGAVTQAAIAQMRQLPPTAEVVKPSAYTISATGPSPLLELVDQTKLALARRELVRVRDYSVVLGIALFKEGELRRPSPSETLARLEQSAVGVNALQRFLLLPRLSKAAYASGDSNRAIAYASELLSSALVHSRDWPQGEAVFYGNLISGRVALARGDVASAKSHLLAAGLTPGSPALDTFGPNMALARDLLKQGAQDEVIQFLSECGRFWKMDDGRLSGWTAAIKQGKLPDFGANLNY